MAIGLGIIGLSADPSAWATAIHLGAIKSLPEDYKLVALATSSIESALTAGKVHGVPSNKCYASADALAKDPDVDLVVVSVKVPLHKHLIVPAIEAGKNVFVEWPIANGIHEVEAIVDAAKAKGVRTVVGLQGRNTPAFLKAKEIVDSGVLGRIVSSTCTISTRLMTNLPERNAYLADASNGANVLTIATPQYIDPIISVLGEFRSLQASIIQRYKQVPIVDGKGNTIRTVETTSPDQVSVQGTVHDGVSLSFSINSVTLNSPEHYTWYIHGEQGSLKVENLSSSFVTAFGAPSLYLGKGATWEEVKVEALTPVDPFISIYKAFAEGRSDAYLDFERASVRHRMIEAMVKSSRDGTAETYAH